MLRHRPIVFHLAALSLAAITPFCLLIAYNVYTGVRAETEEASAKLLRLAESTAFDAERFIRQSEALLTQLAERPLVRALDPARCDPLLDAFARLSPQTANLLTIDAEGRLVCSVVAPPAGARRVVDPKYYLAEAKRTRAFTIGTPAKGFVTGRWVVTLALPILDARGDVSGVIGRPIDLVKFSQTRNEQALPPSAIAGIVNAKGTIITRSVEPEKWVGYEGGGLEIHAQILAKQRGNGRSMGADGVEHLYGFSRIAGTEWFAVVGMPASEVLALVRRAAVINSAIAFMIVLLAAALCYWLAQRIARPIEAIADVTRRVGAGEESLRVAPGGAAEIAGVATEFNHMLAARAAADLERQQAEARLRESEARFRAIFETEPACVTVLDREGYAREKNAAGLVFLEADSLEQLRTRPLIERVLPAYRPAFADLHRRVMHGESGVLQFELEGLKGRRRWLETHAAPLRDAEGKVTDMLGITLDITERKQAELDTARMVAIVESSDDAIISKNLDGMIVLWNCGAERIFGYRADQIIGSSILRLIPPDRRNEEEFILGRIRNGERVDHFETVRMAMDGTLIDVSVTVSPVKDHTGTIIGASKVLRDITQRKRAEEALRSYAVHLQGLSRRLMEVEEQERHRLGRELHDRTGSNLSALLMSIEVLRGKLSPSSMADVGPRLDDAEGLLRETMQHVRDVLSELRPPALDELGLLAALSHHVRLLVQRTGLDLRVEGAEPSPRLTPDVEISLFRIAQEALSNATKHAQATRITLTLHQDAGRIVLAVLDDGRGFDAGRLQSSTTSLGMLTMRERAEAIGAQLTVSSTPGRGTKVTVEVPADSGTGRAMREGFR